MQATNLNKFQYNGHRVYLRRNGTRCDIVIDGKLTGLTLIGKSRQECAAQARRMIEQAQAPALYRNNWRAGNMFPYPEPLTNMARIWVEADGIIYLAI